MPKHICAICNNPSSKAVLTKTTHPRPFIFGLSRALSEAALTNMAEDILVYLCDNHYLMYASAVEHTDGLRF